MRAGIVPADVVLDRPSVGDDTLAAAAMELTASRTHPTGGPQPPALVRWFAGKDAAAPSVTDALPLVRQFYRALRAFHDEQLSQVRAGLWSLAGGTGRCQRGWWL